MNKYITPLQTLSDRLTVPIRNFPNLPAQERQLWKLRFLNHLKADIDELIWVYEHELKDRVAKGEKV